jgi:hypothetical protein
MGIERLPRHPDIDESPMPEDGRPDSSGGPTDGYGSDFRLDHLSPRGGGGVDYRWCFVAAALSQSMTMSCAEHGNEPASEPPAVVSALWL